MKFKFTHHLCVYFWYNCSFLCTLSPFVWKWEYSCSFEEVFDCFCLLDDKRSFAAIISHYSSVVRIAEVAFFAARCIQYFFELTSSEYMIIFWRHHHHFLFFLFFNHICNHAICNFLLLICVNPLDNIFFRENFRNRKFLCQDQQRSVINSFIFQRLAALLL